MSDFPREHVAEELAPVLFELFDQLGFAVAVIAETNRFVYASPRFCDMLGYTEDELLAKPHFYDIAAPKDADRVRMIVRQRREGSQPPPSSDIDLLAADGRHVTTHGGSRVLSGPNGRLIVVTVRDVTLERLRERQLRRYEEACRRMPTGLMIWERSVADNSAVTLQVVNPAAREHLASMSPEDAAGPDVAVHRLPSDIDFSELAGLPAGETVELGEWTPTAEQGVRQRHLLLRGFGLDERSGALISEDLTSLRAAGDERRDLLERLISVGDHERRIIADGIHDDTIQRLAASILLIESVRRHPENDDNEQRVLEVERELRHTVHSLRNLIFELTPPELEEDGLAAAVDRVAAHLFADTEVRVTCDVEVPVDLDHHLGVMTYRIAAEALTNARRHSAASTVHLRLGLDDDRLVGTVIDDGIGAHDVAEQPGHLGLRSMRERAEAFGGQLSVSTSSSGGTMVEWWVPDRRTAPEARIRPKLSDEWRPPDRRRPTAEKRPDSFDGLIETTPDIVSCFDRELRHVYVNAAVEAATGLDRSEFLGRSNRDLGMPSALADQWDVAILAAFRDGEVIAQTFVYDTPEGTRTFDARLVPERSRPDGPVVRVWGVVRDVSSYLRRS